MTDATDIKALRDVKRYGTKATGNEYFKYVTAEMTDGPWVKQEDYFALLTMLEAERQRADNASFRENHLNDMLNDKIQQKVDLRAELAALKGEQVPVALTVWYGSMPESNGKENWTAILHRKGVCISEGITVDRSEYPERVRYAADCMRYLIGEIQDEPDILAYDAGKRSDYAYPVTTPQKPVVLPSPYYGDRHCLDKREVIAAIEAAGGKVQCEDNQSVFIGVRP